MLSILGIYSYKLIFMEEIDLLSTIHFYTHIPSTISKMYFTEFFGFQRRSDDPLADDGLLRAFH